MRHLKGRAHRADTMLLARAALYVKGGDPPPPPVSAPPPPAISDPPPKQDMATQTETCCVDCLEELTAVKNDNIEYRDYFPTPEEMVQAVTDLDAYEEVFGSVLNMQAYMRGKANPIAI